MAGELSSAIDQNALFSLAASGQLGSLHSAQGPKGEQIKRQE